MNTTTFKNYRPGKHGLNLAKGTEGPMTTRDFRMSDDIYDVTVLFVDRISTFMMGLDEEGFDIMSSRNHLDGFQIKEEEDI